MLYLFYGSDISASSKKAGTLISSLREKRPDAAYMPIDADHWHPTIIEEHLGGQGLFSNKYIVFLNRLTENEEAKESFVEYIPAMQESANIFIVLEGKLNAEFKKAFEKSAEKAVESELAKKEGGRFAGGDFNVFALADAVGSRDPFKAWNLYREAVDTGLEPEAILGTLFWQIKSMILASDAPSATASGLSPFVFSKAKRHSGNYSKEESGELLRDIITLYHDGHRGMVDLEFGIERMLLAQSLFNC